MGACSVLSPSSARAHVVVDRGGRAIVAAVAAQAILALAAQAAPTPGRSGEQTIDDGRVALHFRIQDRVVLEAQGDLTLSDGIDECAEEVLTHGHVRQAAAVDVAALRRQFDQDRIAAM